MLIMLITIIYIGNTSYRLKLSENLNEAIPTSTLTIENFYKDFMKYKN
jgi:hypothetical protein